MNNQQLPENLPMPRIILEAKTDRSGITSYELQSFQGDSFFSEGFAYDDRKSAILAALDEINRIERLDIARTVLSQCLEGGLRYFDLIEGLLELAITDGCSDEAIALLENARNSFLPQS